MFARICSNVLDLPHEAEAGITSDNCYIWSSQTIAACRRRLNCPLLQAGDPQQQQQQQQQQRGTGLVCRANRRSSRGAGRGAATRRPTQHRSSSIAGSARQPRQPAVAASSRRPSSSTQQQQGSASASCAAAIGPAQLTSCISAASSHSQLEAVCNAFLGHTAFSASHAALVVSRLHQVTARPGDSQLLLLELLAARLAAAPARELAVCSNQQLADVVWGFARAGYQPDARLLWRLLQQFFAAGEQEQHQQEQQQEEGDADQQPAAAAAAGQPQSDGPAVATLVAGLAGLGFRESSIWARLRPAAAAAAPLLPARHLQQLAWGFATAQAGDQATTSRLAAAVLPRLQQECGPEELVQLVMAFHSLQLDPGSQLFEAAALAMQTRVAEQQAASSSSSSRGLGPRQPAARAAAAAAAAAGAAGRRPQQQQQAPGSPRVQQLLGETAAAVGQAYRRVLGQYDPLLCTLLLFRDHFQPA